MNNTVTAENQLLKKSREEILKMQKEANARALAKRRLQKGILVALNVVMALFILLPLLYAVSIAFMPSGELFTTELNILPENPTLENFSQALVKVPLARFVLNSFLVAGLITFGQIISC